MQSLQSSGLPSIMSTYEFLTQVAWPGVQPSPSGGGGTSAAQEPEQAIEEPVLAEDEFTPLEPSSVVADTSMAHEEVSSPDPMPEQPILQDVPAAPVLDLNEDQPQDEQDV